jgi:methylated-DNA-[protein]-cysteine S-methyltransferase
MTHAFAVFTTAIGACGLAWTDRGICGAQLPERDATATRARLMRRFPDAMESDPPQTIAVAIATIRDLFAGVPDVDLSTLPLDLEHVPSFDRRVYEIARCIPRGRTMTYGEIAAAIGEPGVARAVGQALGRNPVPPIVPCHRVIAAHGAIGGFSAHGGADSKHRLLEIEGVRIAYTPRLFT